MDQCNHEVNAEYRKGINYSGLGTASGRSDS